jgi:hypothetical protein
MNQDQRSRSNGRRCRRRGLRGSGQQGFGQIVKRYDIPLSQNLRALIQANLG